MPASLNSVEYSRSFTFHVDESPRYGNFQNLDYLPAIGKGLRAGEHYVPFFTNQHVFKTVSSWVESWQPWQQRVLLCGIIDRLPTHQLNLLATTLEPVCHRDYVAASRLQYPSTPFRKTRREGSPVLTPNECIEVGLGSSAEQGHLKAATPLVQENNQAEIEKDANERDQSPNSPKSNFLQGEAQAAAYEAINTVIEKVFDMCAVSYNNEVLDENAFPKILVEVSMPVKTELLLKSANESSRNGLQNDEKEVVYNSPEHHNASDRHQLEISPCLNSPLSADQRNDRVYKTKTETTRDINQMAFLNKITKSSPYITESPYRISPIKLNTPDFFGRRCITKLGPLQRSQDLNETLNNQVEPSVPLHLAYKNAKWWPGVPSSGKVYVPARSLDLLTNYKQQLEQIWEWLKLWTDFERVSFVKEVIKSSTTEVITSLAKHVQLRLKQTLDISRLTDNLLLKIFSSLSSKEIASCSQVCRRWRYLCALGSLWEFKCKQLVNDEKLGDLNNLVMRLGGGPNGVDWKKAYQELNKTAQNLKNGFIVPPIKGVPFVDRFGHDSKLQENPEDKVTGLCHKETAIASRCTPPVEELKVKLATESQVLQYKTEDNLSDTESNISEDLIQLTRDYNYFTSGPLKKKQSSNRHAAKKPHHGLYRQTDANGQKRNEHKPADQIAKDSREKVKPEDMAFDIRPRLRRHKDILGKTEASHRLEWRPAEKSSKQTPPDIPVVGQVSAIKRVRKLQGHSGGVLCVHFDHKRLVSGGWDRTIRLWDIRSGRSLHKFYGHRGGVHSIVFDDEIMASGSWDMTIMIWCMKKFVRRLTIHDHKGCVSCLHLHPRYLVSGSHDTTVRVFDRTTLLCYCVISGHTSAVTCLTFDGTCVLSGSTDKTLRLTNIHTQELLHVFEGMQQPVLSIVSQGSLIIAGDSLGRVYFWNKSTGETEAAIEAHEGPVNSLGFWANRLLTASGDATIKEWDVSTMTVVRCLDGHKGPIRQMKMSEKRIVSCSEDGNVRVWDTLSPNLRSRPGKRLSQPKTQLG